MFKVEMHTEAKKKKEEKPFITPAADAAAVLCRSVNETALPFY